MAVTGLAFIMYPVTDMDRSVAFYRDQIGIAPTDVASSFWTEFDVDGQTFGIGTFEQVGTPGTGNALALEVDDIAAAHGRLAERGVEITDPHELPACWISMVRDPDGNQVWLHQRKPRG
ncbi:MAG TPA: VOC family protein [Candidatus Sulfotelmatobacter sp.]|nr:VOC family protein [Candidatus Sulfotelmatobacter sp.]